MSRRLDLSRFQGDDVDEDGFPPTKKKLELNDLKAKTFSHGITKKTKKDLEKEAEEKRRLEEEEAAARVLAEYTDAFENPSSSSHRPTTTALSRGRGFGMGGGFVRAGGAPMMPNVPTGPAAQSSEPPRGPSAMYGRPHRPQPPRAPSPSRDTAPKPKGKRVMDSFLAEIKGNQASRENRLGKLAKVEGLSVSALAARETAGASRGHAEPESTNLFVGNLPYNTTEESLGYYFATMGPVGTVKIMWPRGDEDPSVGGSRRIRAALQGFVAYMKRDDAQDAVNELDGKEWNGNALKVGWSKAVPVPQRASYVLPGQGGSRPRSRSRSPERKPTRRPRSRSRSPSPKRRRRSRSPGDRKRRSVSESSSSRSRSPSRSPPPKQPSAVDKWFAQIPPEQAAFIKAVATKVRQMGSGLEDVLRAKEKDNPKFAFFFDDATPEYHLYHSTISSRHLIPTPPPPPFDDEGYASIYSSDSAEESEKERTDKGKIGKLARKRLESMLRLMSGKRAEIGRAMEFAMNKAEAADEVAEIVCQSLKLEATPVPRKLARLHLVSDILHNSASPIPNVWKYRLAFEQRLPLVFAHLSAVCLSLDAYTGKISADVFKSQVIGVLEVWERWIVFTQEVQENLRAFFAGTKSPTDKPKEASTSEKNDTGVAVDEGERGSDGGKNGGSGFKTSGFKSSFKPLTETSGPPSLAGDDIDGEAMDEDVDGEAMEDLDGAPMEDLDGEAMVEDLDGEAI